MATQERALQEAESAGSAGFVPRLMDRLGLTARADAVFGQPVERAGVTVIPVAKVSWGGGGGGGGGKSNKEGVEEKGEGAGGGGGVTAKPIGFIRMRDGDAEFVPIRDLSSYGPLLITSAIASAIMLGAVRKLFKK